jgi:hypothetical protein
MIAAIMLVSLTIAIVSFIHTILPQAPNTVYAQSKKNINSSVSNLATNGTFSKYFI